jgi:hypothetical protein
MSGGQESVPDTNQLPEAIALPAQRNHDGTPISPDDLFVGDPSKAIGEITSATTNADRRKGGPKIAWPMTRIVSGVFGVGIGLVAVTSLCRDLFPDPNHLMIASIAAGVVLFGLAVQLMKPAITSTYVGTLGAAEFRRLGRKTGSRIFRFQTARELRSDHIVKYTNNVYTGDELTYRWRDAQGRLVFFFFIFYLRKGKKLAPTDHQVHFALAVEKAWTQYRLPQVRQEIEGGGTAAFPVGKNDMVTIGGNLIELRFGGKEQRIAPDEIAHVEVKAGFLEIALHDAAKGLFDAKGLFRFPVCNAADFHVMYSLMERMTGEEKDQVEADPSPRIGDGTT